MSLRETSNLCYTQLTLPDTALTVICTRLEDHKGKHRARMTGYINNSLLMYQVTWDTLVQYEAEDQDDN